MSRSADKNIETLKQLAQKLAAMAAPGSGASVAERDTANIKLRRFLERHGLTAADLISEDTGEVSAVVLTTGEKTLFLQCAFHILQVSKLSTRQNETLIDGLTAGGNPRKATRITLAGVTKVQAADILSCFQHYVIELRERVDELNRERRRISLAVEQASVALISKHRLFGPESNEPGQPAPKLSEEERDALMHALSGLSGKRWTQPAAQLPNERRTA